MKLGDVTLRETYAKLKGKKVVRSPKVLAYKQRKLANKLHLEHQIHELEKQIKKQMIDELRTAIDTIRV